jgi:hypothetical protein
LKSTLMVENRHHNLGLLPRGTSTDFSTVALFRVVVGIMKMAGLSISFKSAPKT